VKIRIPCGIAWEWDSRCIGDVIPALVDGEYFPSLEVTSEVFQEILADTKFNSDPKSMDEMPTKTRTVYKRFLGYLTRLQIEARRPELLRIGEPREGGV
jgi:hypothetical protein